MEAKLKEYRLRRRRQELIESTKEKFTNTKHKILQLITPTIFTNMGDEKKDDEVLLMEYDEQVDDEVKETQIEETIDVSAEVIENETEDVKQESWKYFIFKWSLYTAIWITLYIYFLRIEFGAVFFVISMLIGIYLNTRTRPRKKGEVSAYSVFNENCKSINGTLKAEQFERELIYGPGSIR